VSQNSLRPLNLSEKNPLQISACTPVFHCAQSSVFIGARVSSDSKGGN